jgi:hypothetical protein
MITDEFRKILATKLKDEVNTSNSKIGQGGNTTSPLATSLDVPLTATVSTTAEKSSENVVQVKLEVLGSDITGLVIREAGLFNSTPTLLQRVNFEGVGPFSATERLQIFITMEVE